MAIRPQTSPRHGGDLVFATAQYGTPPAGWLDLSTGINPASYPIGKIVVASPGRLPGRDALDQLLAAARTAYGLPAGAAIAAVPGSEVAIGLLPLIAPAGAVAVVGPTYGSHAGAWQDSARRVIEVGDVSQIPTDVTIAVVVNPNNPDGRTFPPSTLTALARALGERGGLLVVDEAFADATPEIAAPPSRNVGTPSDFRWKSGARRSTCTRASRSMPNSGEPLAELSQRRAYSWRM